MDITWIVGGVVLALVLWVLATYNSLVVKRNRVKEAYSHIDVQLKRRSSLIPNLVEAVKGYVKHEKEVLENVTKARSALMGAKDPHSQAEANNQLTASLKSLFAVAEAYPDLKASENFKTLQEELSDTETKVSSARQFYNTNVLDLNNALETIPSMWIASMFGFSKQEFFTATEEEKKDIEVKF